MKPYALEDIDNLLRQNPAYVAAEQELKPALALANDALALRVEAGWSQAELAARVGANQANISRLESGLANPTLKFLQKLAGALGAQLEVRLRPVDEGAIVTLPPLFAH